MTEHQEGVRSGRVGLESAEVDLRNWLTILSGLWEYFPQYVWDIKTIGGKDVSTCDLVATSGGLVVRETNPSNVELPVHPVLLDSRHSSRHVGCQSDQCRKEHPAN